MKTQKTHINATGCHENANIQVKLTTKRILTPDELRQERKDLNDHLCEALHKYGFHRQDIQVS